MGLPSKIMSILQEAGQVAVEVETPVAGMREFVTVYRTHSNAIIGFNCRFPYLEGVEFVYRIVRFRVSMELIQHDLEVSPDDLIDLQSIFLPNDTAVCEILSIWGVSPDCLLHPSCSAIPV